MTTQVPNLFEAINRTDPQPARFLEGTYRFLNRVSSPYWQQVRDQMEMWLSHVPHPHRKDLRERLASGNDGQFNGAYLELYLHESFLRLGAEVLIHPDTPSGRHPDFLVRDDVQEFYVEARSILQQSDADRAKGGRQAALYDALQALNSPNFFLWIDVQEIGPDDLPKRPLVRALERWLATLNPDEEQERLTRYNTLDVLKRFESSDRGWTVSFRAIPKSLPARGHDGIRPLGMFGGLDVDVVDGVGPLKRALLEKGNAYGAPEGPFIIALGVDWFTARDDFDITGALFGTSQLQFSPTTGETRHTRAGDGFWFGGDRWLRAHVTGVLQVNNLQPALFASASPTLWLHPEPARPIVPPEAWSVMDPTSGEMVRHEARRSHPDLFGIPENWPVGVPFPQGS